MSLTLSPKTLNGSLWLMEPVALRLAIARVLSYPRCPTPRQLAKARRRNLDDADNLAAHALLSTGRDLTDDADPAREAAGTGKTIRAVKGKVGLIAVHGPIQQRLTSELEKAGGTSTEYISRALDALLANDQVGAIVLHTDSFGGSSYGTQEISDKLYASRGRKPIYAAIDSAACSAACWIATSAETVVMTPGGDTGSVGVFAIHADTSKALEAEGIKVTLVKAGRFKAEGNSFEPLTEEARANIQSQVDATYKTFTESMARNRSVTVNHVRDNFGQGRAMNAEQALAAGLIDRILPFETLLSRLTGGASAASAESRKGTSAEVLRARLELSRQRDLAAEGA